MKYRRTLSRRSVLCGAGSIAIGLPFLDAMHTRSVWGQGEAVPTRAITFFFGLGVRPEFAAQGLTGPLAPLAPFAGKIGFSRNLNLGTSSSAGNHDVGSEFVFRGVGNGGASIDQFVREALHGGDAPTAIPSLIAGTFHRNNGKRENHSYRPNGGITDAPYRVPQQLFDRVFGSFTPPSSMDPMPEPRTPPPVGECAVDQELHVKRSILDTVSEQYNYMLSDAAGLGAASRTQMSDHLQKIRELELSVFGDDGQMAAQNVEGAMGEPIAAQGCVVPPEPPAFSMENFDAIQERQSDGCVGEAAFPIAWGEWDLLWRNMADIYALALVCDRTRFGNLQFTSGGERLSIVGDYSWDGTNITFNDPTTAHEYWHGWGSDADHDGYGSREWAGNHTHLVMSRVAYFMQQLDAAMDGNGASVLDNMLLMMGSELGDGGDSHSLKDIFHLWTSAGGRLKVGSAVEFNEMDAKKLYNTVTEVLVGQTMTDDEQPDATSRGLLVA